MQRLFPRRPGKGLLLHHLQVALQYRQWRAQLMTDVGKEVAPRPFQLVHLGHVTGDHQQLLLAVGHDADLQMPSVVQHQVERFREGLLFKILSKFGIAQQVEDILAVIVRPAQPKQLLGKTVTPEDHPLFGGEHHRIRQRLCAAAKAFDQAAQLATALFVAQLHLVQAIEQWLPAAVPRRRGHAAIHPQPPGELKQIPEVPDQ